MSSTFLAQNTQINWNGRHGSVHHVDTRSVLIDFDDASDIEFFTPSAVHNAYSCGVIKIVPETINGTYLSNSSVNKSVEEQKKITRWLVYVKKLDECKGKWGKATQKRVIKEVGEMLGEPVESRPSATDLARKLKAWLQSGLNPNALLNKKVRKRRKSSFSKEMLDLIDEVIDDYYLTRNGPSKEECSRILKQLHVQRMPAEKCIGRSTFIERLDDLDPYEVTLARKGTEAARRLKNDYAGELIIPTYPLECVEIDAVHLNVGILDEETDAFLGTLIIYVGIDRFTRCVLGYSMSIKGMGQGESVESVVELIKHMSLPKEQMPHTEHSWDCYGIVRTVLCDAGTAFNNESVTALIPKLKTARIITPTKTPKKKPFIERFFRTLRGQFASKMPGYAPSRMRGEELEESMPRGGCLYLSDVKQALDVYIVDVYHQSGHSGLDNQAPAAVWNNSASLMPLSPMIKAEVFDEHTGIMEEATLQKTKGIQKNNLFYNNTALKQLYWDMTKNKKSKDKPKVKYVYNKKDLSHIYVINPQDMSMISVRCTDRSVVEGTSLKQYKARKTDTPQVPKQTFNQSEELFANAKERQFAKKKRKATKPSKNKLEPAQPQKDDDLDSLLGTGHVGDTVPVEGAKSSLNDSPEGSHSLFPETTDSFPKRG